MRWGNCANKGVYAEFVRGWGFVRIEYCFVTSRTKEGVDICLVRPTQDWGEEDDDDMREQEYKHLSIMRLMLLNCFPRATCDLLFQPAWAATG